MSWKLKIFSQLPKISSPSIKRRSVTIYPLPPTLSYLNITLNEDHHDDDHDENHDEEHDEHEEAGAHKDVILNYKLTCKNPDKLKSVSVDFFNVFSNFTELELVYLGPNTQMSTKLSSSRPSVDLTR